MLDCGVSIDAVSKSMDHSSTRTTELYYARIRAEDAFTELESVFSDYDAPAGCPVPKGAD